VRIRRNWCRDPVTVSPVLVVRAALSDAANTSWAKPSATPLRPSCVFARARTLGRIAGRRADGCAHTRKQRAQPDVGVVWS